MMFLVVPVNSYLFHLPFTYLNIPDNTSGEEKTEEQKKVKLKVSAAADQGTEEETQELADSKKNKKKKEKNKYKVITFILICLLFKEFI